MFFSIWYSKEFQVNSLRLKENEFKIESIQIFVSLVFIQVFVEVVIIVRRQNFWFKVVIFFLAFLNIIIGLSLVLLVFVVKYIDILDFLWSVVFRVIVFFLVVFMVVFDIMSYQTGVLFIVMICNGAQFCFFCKRRIWMIQDTIFVISFFGFC